MTVSSSEIELCMNEDVVWVDTRMMSSPEDVLEAAFVVRPLEDAKWEGDDRRRESYREIRPGHDLLSDDAIRSRDPRHKTR